MAAEQKARTTYDNVLRLVDDPDVCDVIKFLREREIVHYQRFGENKIRSCGKDLRYYVSRLAIGFECSVIQYFIGYFFL